MRPETLQRRLYLSASRTRVLTAIPSPRLSLLSKLFLPAGSGCTGSLPENPNDLEFGHEHFHFF